MSHWDACESQVLVCTRCYSFLLVPPVHFWKDQNQTSISLFPVRLTADMAGGVRKREKREFRGRTDMRKLPSGDREEEKAHCDWQMTQALRDTWEASTYAHWPEGMQANILVQVRGVAQHSRNDAVKPEGIQMQYAPVTGCTGISCSSFYWLTGSVCGCGQKSLFNTDMRGFYKGLPVITILFRYYTSFIRPIYFPFFIWFLFHLKKNI